MNGAAGPEDVSGTKSLRLDTYLDADGAISLGAGHNLIAFLDRNIADEADSLAYRFLDYSSAVDGQAVELTWARLGVRMQAVAARLQQVTTAGERVAVLAPQGLDYIVGFFAAIKAGNIAVPLFAPELPGHAERLDAVLTDTQPSVVLTTAAAGADVQSFLRGMPRSQRPRVIAIDEVPDPVGSSFTPVELGIDDVAYLQYTSGSTRTPAGVEITHRAAGTNLVQMIVSLDLGWDSHGISWLPLYHDMGLLMIGFSALCGMHLTLLSPMAFIRRPQRWIRALSEESQHGRVVSPAPNFAFDLVAQRGRPAQGQQLNLGNVVLINGSDPVSMDSIEGFNEAFGPYGLPRTAIHPSYGMAEATLFVSTIDPHAEPKAVYFDRKLLSAGYAAPVPGDAPDAVPQVSCGRIARSQWGVITDPEASVELPDGEVGEVWLSGNNIGRGYWRRPEESRQTFGNKLQTRLAEGSHAQGAPTEATWLRTGDLGVYVDHELFITGRIKDLVIIDGRNHYPQDIEATVVEASTAVRPGFVAAFSVPENELPDAAVGNTSERLVIVAERAPGAGRVNAEPVIEEIRAGVSRRHGLLAADVRFAAAGAIPRTTSGKLARSQCRAQYLSGAFSP